MSDAVNQPLHYNAGDIEAIDAARAMASGWDQQTTVSSIQAHMLLNAFKYIWRAPLKGNYEQDIRKAIWYLRMAINDDPRRE